MKKQITFFFAFFSLTLFAQNTFSISGSDCFSNITLQKQATNADGKIWFKSTTSVSLNSQTLGPATDFLQCRWYATTYGTPMWVIGPLSTADYLYRVNNNSNATPPTSGWEPFDCINNITVNLVLPVELIIFDAQNTKGSNRLTWSTASEKNNEGFDIERSLDGTDFQKIGFVKGNGTTNQPQQYTYTDALVSAVTYYRLKQLDTDGNFTYSKVVSVESNGEGLRVYPTLASDGVLTVQGGQSDDFIVTNLLGQTVLMGKTTPQINVSALARGTYLLKVGSEVSKFVKQ